MKEESKKVFQNPNHELLEEREIKLYETEGDTRGPFYRDYTRILHSTAYRRLKHKTQVFFNVDNDHICTRLEHVYHVESVSHSIALGLNLDTELTRAIACGHDLGHAPFGHEGEKVLDKILNDHLSTRYKNSKAGKTNSSFWHERNGLYIVDNLELLPDMEGNYKNLGLTYAVRDGIISHCGEIDINGIMPRSKKINLSDFEKPGQYEPYTWEGCVVKLADKIAYLGRDIEDAISLNMLSLDDEVKLKSIAKEYIGKETLNTTSIMHTLIGDICKNSSPEKGICMSKGKAELLERVKEFNYKCIYLNEQLQVYKDYVALVLNSIFNALYSAYSNENVISKVEQKYKVIYPKLTGYFLDWLCKYCNPSIAESHAKDGIDYKKYDNTKIYKNLSNKDVYVRAIVDFIAGMTDSFAITIFNELISF